MDREEDRPGAQQQEAEGLGASEEARTKPEGPKAPSRIGRRTRAGGFQKRLPMRVARLKEAYPTAKVELWCEDEHRLGLKPILRKVCSPIGQRPTVKVHHRYERSYLYSFVRPNTGEVFTGSSYPRSTWGCSRWPSNTPLGK